MIDDFYMRPTLDAIAEAKKIPGGWVYVFDSHYRKSDVVPPSAIVGVWKVDDEGNIVGNFIKNPKHRNWRI